MPRLSPDAPYLHPEVEDAGTRYGAYVEIGQGTRLQNVVMGDYSYCDRYCDIANARIGKFANIASFVRIGPTDHPMDGPALHHFLYRAAAYWDDADDDRDFFARRAARLCHVGHDTWIGHGAIILPEVTIGHGAIVAAGTVVTKDVDPYTIVGGNTARLIRRRHTEAIAARLVALAWWDWPHAVLRTRLDDFRTLGVEAFLERYED